MALFYFQMEMKKMPHDSYVYEPDARTTLRFNNLKFSIEAAASFVLHMVLKCFF